MAYDDLRCLRVAVSDGVATVTIDHPPLNLLDLAMIGELDAAGRALAADDAVRVVVLRSANPDFFIAHADVTLIQRMPTTPPPPPTELGPFHAMVDRFRTMAKATIGVVEGIARGGGSELLLSLDMRFARARPRACWRNPRSHSASSRAAAARSACRASSGGRARWRSSSAATTSPADLAERWGYVNRALPPAELWPFVDRLARAHRLVSRGGDRAGEGGGGRGGSDRRRRAARRSRLLQPLACVDRNAGAHAALHGRGRTDGRGGEGRVVLGAAGVLPATDGARAAPSAQSALGVAG